VAGVERAADAPPLGVGAAHAWIAAAVLAAAFIQILADVRTGPRGPAHLADLAGARRTGVDWRADAGQAFEAERAGRIARHAGGRPGRRAEGIGDDGRGA